MKDTEKHNIKLTGLQTGSLSLNKALEKGGFARGKLIEISGEESAGKSTLALTCIATCQHEGGTAAVLDSDCSFNATYAKKIGVNLNDLIFSQPKTAENAFDMVFSLISKANVNLILVDSLASLLPQKQLDSSMLNNSALQYHQTLAEGFCKLRSLLAFKGGECTIIFTNQLRVSASSNGSLTYDSGVKNLIKNFMDTRVYMSNGDDILNKKGIKKGSHCNMLISQLNGAYTKKWVTTPIIFNSGFASSYETLQMGLRTGVVKKTKDGFYALAKLIGKTGLNAKFNLDKNLELRALINREILLTD